MAKKITLSGNIVNEIFDTDFSVDIPTAAIDISDADFETIRTHEYGGSVFTYIAGTLALNTNAVAQKDNPEKELTAEELYTMLETKGTLRATDRPRPKRV